VPTTLPPEIQVEEFAGNISWFLPPRRLGKLRFFGLIPLAIGISGIALLIWFTKTAIQNIGETGLRPFLVFLALIAVWGVIFVLWPIMRLGLFALAGHTRIVISGDRLTLSERCGPIRWTRRCRLYRVKEIGLSGPEDGVVRINGRPSDAFPEAAGTGFLIFKTTKKGLPLMVLGYPRQWLDALGNDIASRIRVPLVQLLPNWSR
jgi:hypothetical protein